MQPYQSDFIRTIDYRTRMPIDPMNFLHAQDYYDALAEQELITPQEFLFMLQHEQFYAEMADAPTDHLRERALRVCRILANLESPTYDEDEY